MTRAGREPAEDLKRRMIAACEEAGLEATGMFRLIDDVRIIFVDSPKAATIENHILSLIAQIHISGWWPGTIDMRCGTPEGMHGPTMRGRGRVPLKDLIQEIRATLAEREQVIAARKLGIKGPYRFERSEWICEWDRYDEKYKVPGESPPGT